MSASNGYIDYDAVLADLEAKREQIDAAISAIQLIRGAGGGSGGGASVASGVVASNAFFTMGIGEAARKYLEIVKGKATVQQITKALEQGGMPPLKINTVYAALRRREAVTGDLIRVGEEWGLKEWFSNISLPKPTRTKGKKKPGTAKKAAKKTGSAKTPAAALKAPEPSASTEPVSPTAVAISMVDATEKILTEHDRPVHATALAEELRDKYGKNSNRDSIRASLPKDAKNRFVNIGGNVWALTAWPESKRRPPA
jgi:DNA-directed RNA polymerase delta subunit